MRAKLIVFLACATAALSPHAQVPNHIGKYDSTEADTQAILKVTTDFRSALTSKDPKKLSALLLHSKILFASPASPARVRKVRSDLDLHADGIPQAGAAEFLSFIAASKESIEERFYNIRITQDGHVAWVIFDFEFLQGGRVENYGVETWQMLKTADDSWKIMSVVWSSRGTPK